MTRKRQENMDHPIDKEVHCLKPPDPGRFDNFKNGAYALALAVFAASISFNGFSDMWALRSEALEFATFAMQVLLFVLLVVLVFRWIIATHHELDMWLTYLEHPFTRQEMYGAICGISVTVGLMAAFPHKVLLVTGLFTAYSLLNYWTQWLCNDHFSHALAKTRKMRISKDNSQVLEVMEHYWLKQPQLGRIATTMFFSAIAFSFALAGAFQQAPQKNTFELIAYAVLILTILVSEIVIAIWRYKLDRGIAAVVTSVEG